MYTIRDVDKALLNYITARNLTVRMENLDVRVRPYFSVPDEMYVKKRTPAICIESGYMINYPMGYYNWDVEYADSGNNVVVSGHQFIVIKYAYKVGFYVTFKPHCTYLEEQFIRMFPLNMSLLVTDEDGETRYVMFTHDGNLVNLDFEKKMFLRDRALNESELEGDLKLYRRDLVLTAQLEMEESQVESVLRPYVGVQLTVAQTTIASFFGEGEVVDL